MVKTTVYLPVDLKRAIEAAAARRDVSEAEIIRDSLRQILVPARPRPTAGVFAGADQIAERADEFLAGFGEK